MTSNEPMDFQNELDETQRALREVTLMMEQSQGELAKITQRNTAITSHLQQLQKQGTTVEDLKMSYDSALDVQQRLFVMRGQLEKLQNDKGHLEKYKATLENIVSGNGAGGDASSAGAPSAGTKSQMAGIEMIVNAQEAERQRLSRQMHDGPAQALSNFILQTEIAMRLLDVDPAQAKDELGNLKTSAMGTFQRVRSFIFELRPMMLDDLGLVPTLRKYADAFKEQAGLDVSVTVTGTERRLESYLEVMIFRAVQELLGNASRHSQATLIKVQIDLGNDTIRVSVEDNGKGFSPEILKESNNLGLKLIRERSEMLGGSFEVDSSAGSGARISFSVPAKV
ncbi:MAG: ATP-binding protein [Anaerolineales bacterium]|uniref:sensor histidine kinase n=1 Tax=Candidatus Villigracilis affinis TaxID=3140682 RepID=UPI001B426CBA|nr:ATP-binding protein [Anaerolineales bacterium]MBK9604727.1 ATP-binding protein [Anaerolineales bacterium]MBL0345788.1 ATP-binding protein [Anaerolineales bacterium]MBP8047521.1 ATP-binding protein [Anaerolineales bacterium]